MLYSRISTLSNLTDPDELLEVEDDELFRLEKDPLLSQELILLPRDLVRRMLSIPDEAE
jgi:hypothetical protein